MMIVPRKKSKDVISTISMRMTISVKKMNVRMIPIESVMARSSDTTLSRREGSFDDSDKANDHCDDHD
jgi:hypothetical protein